jgi:hypothetical protein
MSAERIPVPERDTASAAAVRAAQADRRAAARLAGAIADLSLDEGARLDERTRAAVNVLLRATVAAAEQEIAGHATRVLMARAGTEVAARLAGNAGVLSRLIEAGLLRDADLVAELIAQARIDLIDEALVAQRAPGTRPTLLARLTNSADGVTRHRAIAYLVADSRRRLPAAPRHAELPPELYHRLAWSIAAVLRERLGDAAGPLADRALTEATERSIAAHDEGERVDTAALHLAVAIDAAAGDLPQLLLDVLVEGRLALFVAILSHAIGLDPVEARGLTLDAPSDRLWLALRALGFGREAIARVGWLLSEADSERDVELLADAIDPVAALDSDEAGSALAPLALARDFRAAVRALARDGGR